MSTILLQNWDCENEFVSLNSVSWKADFLTKEKGEFYNLKGFAAKHGESMTAVYVDNGEVYFQYNKNKWSLSNSENMFHYWRFLQFEIFSIKSNKRTKFRKIIKNRKCLIHYIFDDPTFDKIDKDNIYFLGWLSSSLKKPGWCDKFVEMWSNQTGQKST